MTDTIKDGTGKGFLARVDQENRLHTFAVVNTEEHDRSELGSAYIANTTDTADTLTVGSGQGGPMLYLKNDSSSEDMVIQKIISNSSVNGGVLKIIRNPTEGTISANNIHIPVNSNFGDPGSAVVTSYSWDETGTTGMIGFTNGKTWESFITAIGPSFHPIEGSIIIPQGQSIMIEYTQSSGVPAEFACGIRFYMEVS